MIRSGICSSLAKVRALVHTAHVGGQQEAQSKLLSQYGCTGARQVWPGQGTGQEPQYSDDGHCTAGWESARKGGIFLQRHARQLR